MAVGRSLLAIVAAFAQPNLVAGNSMYLAELCRGHTCHDYKFPILDYVEEEKKCVCRAHPCWDDNGLAHNCNSEDFPHLSFSYDDTQTLQCTCSSVPSYSSTYILKDLCPGNYCNDEAFPIVDYNPDTKKCFCRAHPCWDLDGMRHDCSDSAFPILRYREDETSTGSGKAKPVCECLAKFSGPDSHTEL